MNRPSMMTRELSAMDLKAMGKIVMNAVQVSGALFLVAYALGFRAEKPGERFDGIEQRVSVLEREVAKMAPEISVLVRMGCLKMSRREAQLAGTCAELPTQDESTRVRSRP